MRKVYYTQLIKIQNELVQIIIIVNVYMNLV